MAIVDPSNTEQYYDEHKLADELAHKCAIAYRAGDIKSAAVYWEECQARNGNIFMVMKYMALGQAIKDQREMLFGPAPPSR